MPNPRLPKGVSGTAFVVNYSRARKVRISRDVYARLWVTPEAVEAWKALAERVYPNDDLNVSLRNRFYLERIREFVRAHEDPAVVCLAAGFDNYPFLVEEPCRFVEVDLPAVIGWKRRMAARWMRAGRLPRREVVYLSADLAEPAALERSLKRLVGSRPGFATLEGITYYLAPRALSRVFAVLRRVLRAGSRVALDYWAPDSMTYPVMVRLKRHFDQEFGASHTGWHFYGREFFRGLPGYAWAESKDIAGLERAYSRTRRFQGRDAKIPVRFGVLERIR